MGSFSRAARVACLITALASIASPAGQLSNRRAPGFSLMDMNMQQHDPADYRGKPLLIEIMQTDCPRCIQSTGILELINTKYSGKIQILSIVVPPDSIDKVKAYIKNQGVKTPILFDCGQVAASYLKISPSNPTAKFPHLFLIDQDGMIRNDFDPIEANKNLITPPMLSGEIDKLLSRKR